MRKAERKPEWLKRPIPRPGKSGRVAGILDGLDLNTVCREAHCPNRGECYGHGTATFLLLGPACTRDCAFCAVGHGTLLPDPMEPERVAEAVDQLGLDFCVLTMVTRDDLRDGGAAHVAETVKTLRRKRPGLGVEALISDLAGCREALNAVLAAGPDVLNHNLETVPRLYPSVRPQADYRRSLELIQRAAGYSPRPVTKSGLMVGLGESLDEIRAAMRDLRDAGCDLLTIGQYLAPSSGHHPVVRYVPPDEFDELAAYAGEIGFAGCESGPYVRSSYRAAELFQYANQGRKT